MIVHGAMVLQTLTNLATAAPGPGLPPRWRLQPVRGAPAPFFAVTDGQTLKLEADAAVGFATYELSIPLQPDRAGALVWRWRTPTAIDGASLREKNTDDSPVRVMVVFRDGRAIFYIWGNTESPGEAFLSWTSDSRLVVVLRGADAADGDWRHERRDPFTDYRGGFGRDPPEIIAAGASVDSDTLRWMTTAEVADIEWRDAAQE